MEYYPILEEVNDEVATTAHFPPDRTGYTSYIEGCFRAWCKYNDISYIALLASLMQLVLLGNIRVEKKDRNSIIVPTTRQTLPERLLLHQTPADYLYNLYNKYDVPVSDNENQELMLSYKNALLQKLGLV